MLKTKLGFFLTLVSVIGLFGLAYFKDVEIGGTLASILGIYIIGKSITNVGHSYNASRDENCDTESVISKLEE
jgi:hypothetical protein